MTEDEKLENEFELEMLALAIPQTARNLEADPEGKDELEENFNKIKKLRMLINKFERCLKLIDPKEFKDTE